MAADFLISGVHTVLEYPPIALGMCMAYARQEFANEPCLEISPQLISTEQQLTVLLKRDYSAGQRRHILLFSNYLWNTDANLDLSRSAKRLDPTCVTIHGGPNTPAYAEASRSFLFREPHVDFVVAGEGEETLKELLEALVFGHTQTADVSGLRFLSRGTFVETAARGRAIDVNRFPSPYLTGFFDDNDVTRWQSATIETFRGCPYGCTFCDWGSIMGSKVKTFDIDRVAAEVDWVASKKIGMIWIADSNFGISQRDLTIAQHIADVKKRTGFPKGMILTFAKNVKSRVVDIVQVMVDAGLLGQGIISLQTSDPATLQVIRRSNIRTSEYEKLRNAFAERGLPLCVELMMALPGSTLEAFKGDLAYHFDLPIEVFVHRTVMLVNSPMADPTYQREHGIEVDEQSRVIAVATMSSSDIETASVICRTFQGVHRYGILRYVLRWLQWERDLNPLDVIHDLIRDNVTKAQHPLLGALVDDASIISPTTVDLVNTLVSFREQFRSASSWDALSTQFISWVSRRYNIGENDVLNELGQLQACLMPSAGRLFPDHVPMKHNVAQWYADWLGGTGAALSTYGHGILVVDDPLGLSNRSYFESLTRVASYSWELESVLAQSRRRRPVVA